LGDLPGPKPDDSARVTLSTNRLFHQFRGKGVRIHGRERLSPIPPIQVCLSMGKQDDRFGIPGSIGVGSE